MVDQGKIEGLADNLEIVLRAVFGDLVQQLPELCIQQLGNNRLQVRRHVRLYLEQPLFLRLDASGLARRTYAFRAPKGSPGRAPPLLCPVARSTSNGTSLSVRAFQASPCSLWPLTSVMLMPSQESRSVVH